MAFFVTHDDDRAALEAAKAADEGVIFREVPVAGQRREVIDDLADVVEEMGAFAMARDLDFLRGRELAVGLAEETVGLCRHAADFISDIHDAAVAAHIAQLGNLVFQLKDRFFEFEVHSGGP